MKEWFQETLFDWIYTLLYGVLEALLRIVKLVESFFDIFAGTAKVSYQGESEFLIDIFFSNNAVTNAFWAMTLIAIVMAFMFCVYSVARKVTDVTGSAKHTIGQIMSNFFRCMLTLLLLNAILIAGLNISNVLLDRINYAMLNAGILNEEDGQREFTDSEYATMARVLATVGNYSVNPSSDSRYNINSCFNAVRGDLYSLQSAGVFDYEYELGPGGRHCWQSALALLASSADLTTELPLDVHNDEVADAFNTVVYQLNNNANFIPVESVVTTNAASAENIKTDVLIFLITGMEAANNDMYNTGDIYDNLRTGYFAGSKDYTDMTQVRKDFDIWKMDYLVGYVVSIVFILIMAICIFNLIVRLFNLLLLYISAPLFVSSMPLDEGAKFQNWTQAFIIQMFSGFGMVVAMRLYLIMIPIIMSSDLVFFSGEGIWYSFLNLMARTLMVLGGAWAVLKSSNVISGILAGNPGMAALNQEGQTSSVVTRGARMALQDTAKLAKQLTPAKVLSAPARALNAVADWRRGIADSYHKLGDSHRARAKQRTERMEAKKNHLDSDKNYQGAKKDYKDRKGQQKVGKKLTALTEPVMNQALKNLKATKGQQAPLPPDRSQLPPPPPAPPTPEKSQGSGSKSDSSVRVPDYPKPPPLSIWDKKEGTDSSQGGGNEAGSSSQNQN